MFKGCAKIPVCISLTLGAVCLSLGLNINVSLAEVSGGGNIADDRIDSGELKKEVINSFGKGRRENPEYAMKRGMIATGLKPAFAEGVKCRGIDDHWAMDYSGKRGRKAYHGGIDIPAPKGTPILAAADGVVVAKFMNKKNPKGIEIMLRHSPEDTGHPMWIYTQYTHLKKMPPLEIGQKVRMGEVIGKTSNTGISGQEARRKHGKDAQAVWSDRKSGARRHALHFGMLYSSSRKYMRSKLQLIPVDAYWMDPNALYRKSGPYDSASLKALPKDEKMIPIPYMTPDGKFFPEDTKVIWPYSCQPE